MCVLPNHTTAWLSNMTIYYVKLLYITWKLNIVLKLLKLLIIATIEVYFLNVCIPIPTQVICYPYPKVTGTVNKLQDLAMEGILVDWLPGSAGVQNLAFAWIKFHVPSMFPFLKVVKATLENVAFIFIIYGEVDCGVICKQPGL